MARRIWDSLSDSYRKRLSRNGITREAYERGDSLKAARGHSETPEKDSEIKRHPERFADYLLRNPGKVPRERGDKIERALRHGIGRLEGNVNLLDRNAIRTALFYMSNEDLDDYMSLSGGDIVSRASEQPPRDAIKGKSRKWIFEHYPSARYWYHNW
jgi:hypothetical protein